MSRQTILAARRVVPPDLVAPAPLSNTSRKDITPEDVPPPERCSYLLRSREKLVPVPEPYLNTRASFCTREKMDIRSSFTRWMKQAEHWGCS